MFQYAALVGISSRHGYEYCIPPSLAEDAWKDHQLLQAFDLPGLKVRGWQVAAKEFRERQFHYDAAFVDECPNDADLYGYFQSERYFKHVEDRVRRDFQFNSSVEDHCRNAMMPIGQPVVSLHVRRTDYLEQEANHPTCSMEYYEQALEMVPESMPVLVFSDDIGWCTEQPLFKGSRWLYSNHKSNIVDMCLMTHCSHHIIANSSFSWWGAWLGKNPDKTVIAPRRWFGTNGKTKDYDTSDVTPPNWHRI